MSITGIWATLNLTNFENTFISHVITLKNSIKKTALVNNYNNVENVERRPIAYFAHCALTPKL